MQQICSCLRLLSLCMLPVLLYSCNTGKENSAATSIFGSDFVDIDNFRDAVQKELPALEEGDSARRLQLLRDSNGLLNTAYAYKLNDYKPLWMDASGMRPAAVSLPAALQSLWEEGLDTGRYQIAALRLAVNQLKTRKDIPFDSLVYFDKSLTTAWIDAARDLLLGTVDMRRKDSLWFAKNDTFFDGPALLVKAWQDNSDLPAFDHFSPKAKIYAAMKKALASWRALERDSLYRNAKQNIAPYGNDSTVAYVIDKELQGIALADGAAAGLKSQLAVYQYYHQLKSSGLRDSATVASLKQMPETYIAALKLNMDRIRALPQNLEGEYVWVTIPLMEVDYVKDDAVLFHSRVVVGKASRQTPTLWANMTNIVFNPHWGVPPTILKKDVGPGVSRSGTAYLASKGLRAFDAKGNDVTAQVNAVNYNRYHYKQAPGERNSLGAVKFNLPNPFDIYLHDTPHRENFDNRYRALSSGCVRVQHPKVLAEMILNDERFTADKIDTIIATKKTTTQRLDRKIPVYIIYTTVAEDSTGSGLRYLNDVYGRDEKVISLY